VLATIQRRVPGQDESGQPLEVWATLRDEWVSLLPVTGREYFAASGERADITHKVAAPYGSGALPADRILVGSRVLEIRSVIDIDERHRDLQLMCTELVG
jgi:SPP1 family predicted phage head-tail adaptor